MLEDAYVGLLAVLMLGSMLVNVLVNVSGLTDEACRSSACTSDRVLLSGLAAAGALAVSWSMARAVGPVHMSPGAASWLVATPVDRGELLRTRLWGMFALAAGVTAPIAAAAGTLAGLGAATITAFALGAAAIAALGTAALTHRQIVGRHPAALLVPLALVLVWAGLVVIATDTTPTLRQPGSPGALGWSLIGVLWLGVLLLALRATALTRRLRRSDVAPGGALVPGLGGALAALDLALMYDVLLAHRSRRRSVLKPVRGGPSGLGALVWRDVVRLRRNLGSVVLLAGSVALPYAVDALGGGVIVIVTIVLTGFVVGLPLLVSLRVLARSAGMQRMFPTSVGATRAAALTVPAVLLVLHGLACAWALRDVTELPVDVVQVAFACGVGALAASVRWVSGRPPDYGRPLVSSPAGAVPTNLYGSAVRGLDVALLTSAPLLISPTGNGAVISLLISGGILAYLCLRR